MSLGDLFFVMLAATGRIGPIWPRTFLGCAVIAVILSMLALYACLVFGFRKEATVACPLILLGIAALNFWAAAGSSDAV